MRFPVGEAATLPYILGGLILAVILLIGYLIFTTAPSRLLSNLQDLRSDIIFLRIEIDQALRRYETLSEGETLPDALQKELSGLLSELNVIAYAHSNMHKLIEKMNGELPNSGDTPEEKEQKANQIALDKDSYFLHDAKCTEIVKSLETKSKELNRKMVRVSAVTEAWASANTIRASLAQQLQLMERVEGQLKQSRQAIDYYLSNPDKIPEELRGPSDQSPG